MRIIETVVKGLLVLGLTLSIASCCCTGGVDDDYSGSPDDTDLNLPGQHDEGTGGNG
jgi:hypothetical protein